MPISSMKRTQRWQIYALGSLLLVAITWAYWPGLSGPFLFDDYGNLDVLGAYGRIQSWPTLLYYLSSGNADPTGRPIALLSFLLDATEWPANPWPFKRTNLALHLINTALLAWLVARLQTALQRKNAALCLSCWTPMLAAAIWGAHPFFVSTTLYVVQREAMLPMAFVLLGMLAWIQAVSLFQQGRSQAAWTWATLGVGIATLLAGLSKANGFLTPMLAGLTYLWFLRPQELTPRRNIDRAAVICLGIPSLLLVGYLAVLGWQLWALPQLGGRDWSLAERLLSEPRALWSYLWRLALPRAGGGGLYADGFPVSHGWLEPITTLPAFLGLVTATMAAVRLRKRYPLATFAWLFFLAAHLLESTVVPLELYFEHRNYLPAAMFGWPLAHALLQPGTHRDHRRAGALLLLLALLLLTHQRAIVWGNPHLLSALTGLRNDGSARAQVDAAGLDIEQGRITAGLSRIRAAQQREPQSVDVAITAIGIECTATGALARETLARTRHTLATAKTWNYGLYEWIQRAVSDPATLHCRGFGLPGLRLLVDSAETNPRNIAPSRRRDLWHIRGRIALAAGQPHIALQWFNAALESAPDADYALVQAGALGDAGQPALGARHLGFYRQQLGAGKGGGVGAIRDMAGIHRWLLQHYGYYDGELARLEMQLEADARSTRRQ
jgi:hypothetical protein